MKSGAESGKTARCQEMYLRAQLHSIQQSIQTCTGKKYLCKIPKQHDFGYQVLMPSYCFGIVSPLILDLFQIACPEVQITPEFLQ